MDFLPGNDSSEWHILGGEHSNTYQQVTLQEPMGWSGLSLDCYKSACSKNSGMHIDCIISHNSRTNRVEVEFGRNSANELWCRANYRYSHIWFVWKEGKRYRTLFSVDRTDSGKGVAVCTHLCYGMDIHGETFPPVSRWKLYHLLS